MTDRWSFYRFVRESWQYTRPMSLRTFLRKLLPTWFRFNRKQKLDELQRKGINDYRSLRSYLRRGSSIRIRSAIHADTAAKAGRNVLLLYGAHIS